MKQFVATGLFLALTVGVTASNAAELGSGEPACLTKEALVAMRQAQAAEDQATRDWLLGGACVVFPKAVSVAVVEDFDDQTSLVKARISGRQMKLFVESQTL